MTDPSAPVRGAEGCAEGELEAVEALRSAQAELLVEASSPSHNRSCAGPPPRPHRVVPPTRQSPWVAQSSRRATPPASRRISLPFISAGPSPAGHRPSLPQGTRPARPRARPCPRQRGSTPDIGLSANPGVWWSDGCTRRGGCTVASARTTSSWRPPTRGPASPTALPTLGSTHRV